MRCKRCRFDLWVGENTLEEGIETHPGILAWSIPVDREAWRAISPQVTESETAVRLSIHTDIKM